MRHYETYSERVTEERLAETVCDLCNELMPADGELRPWRLEAPTLVAPRPRTLELTFRYKALDLCPECRELLRSVAPLDIGKIIDYFGHWREEASELVGIDEALYKASEHPVQPLVTDKYGVLRFQANAIVRFLLGDGTDGMNRLAEMPFSREDRLQFAQLIGYSLCGFGDLPYVDDDDYARAEAQLGEEA